MPRSPVGDSANARPPPLVAAEAQVWAGGRPLRIAGAIAVADATAELSCETDPALSNLGRAKRKALGRLWLEDARLEHSAVSAFLTLSGELAALNAPASLVRRAIDAARDESVHTRLCLEGARRHTGIAWSLPPFRPPEPPRRSIRTLVSESWHDGCVGEGIAACAAREGAKSCIISWTRAALETIARDEARHADLAWRILEWCLALPEPAGEEAHEALTRSIETVNGLTARFAVLPACTLRAQGRVPSDEMAKIADRHLGVSRRLARSMLARRAGPR